MEFKMRMPTSLHSPQASQTKLPTESPQFDLLQNKQNTHQAVNTETPKF